MKRTNAAALVLTAAAGALAGGIFAARRNADEIAPAPLALPPALPVSQTTDAIVEAIVEAVVVPATPRRMRRAITGTVVLALLACILAAGCFALRPHLAVAAPTRVFTGRNAILAYSAGGGATIEARAFSEAVPRGLPLEVRAGNVTIPAQMLARGRDVRIAIRAHDLFGSDERVVTIAAEAPPVITRTAASDAPVVDGLSLSAPAARAGSSLVAHYRTNVRAGSVRLVDAAGAVWSSAPLRGDGVAVLAVPVTHERTPFVVQVQAFRGTRVATAAAGFVAEPPPAQAQSREPGFTMPPSLRAGAVAALAAGGMTDARLTLTTQTGATIAVAQRAGNRLRLAVPAATLPQPAFATLSYQHGRARETLIRRTTIVP